MSRCPHSCPPHSCSKHSSRPFLTLPLHTHTRQMIRPDWHGLLTKKCGCVWGGRSARHGFMWWELDWVYLGLRALASLGIVWDMKVVTDEVVKARYLLGNKRPALSRIYRITCPYPSNHHLAPISLLMSIFFLHLHLVCCLYFCMCCVLAQNERGGKGESIV